MLFDLLAKGYINSEVLLLKNYKKLGLSENQVVIILLIMHSTIKSLTPKEISDYTNLDLKTVQAEVDDLIDKQLIKVTSKNIDLKGLAIKLVQLIEQDTELNDNDLIKGLNTIFNTKLSLEDINYLKSDILPKLSKEDILILATNSNAKDFNQFKKELTQKSSSEVKPITKINWL